MSIPALLLTLILLSGLCPAIGAQEWDWEFGYEYVSEPNAMDYVVEQTNARRFSEGPIDYWCPTDNGSEARITQHFAFTNTIAQAYLSVEYIYSANFSDSSFGYGSLWGSKDGLCWLRLGNASKPKIAAHGTHYEALLPDELLGGRELWIQARLYTEGWSIMSQFLRHDKEVAQADCFELKVDLNEVHKATPPTPSTTTPRRASAQVNLDEGTLQAITLLDGGQGYSKPPVVQVVDTTGVTIPAVASVTDGQVATIRLPESDLSLTAPVRVFISAPPYMPLPTIPGHSYQLYSSINLLEWQPAGAAFTASGTETIQEFDHDESGRFYQICHLMDQSISH
jgi:hypothetical protein